MLGDMSNRALGGSRVHGCPGRSRRKTSNATGRAVLFQICFMFDASTSANRERKSLSSPGITLMVHGRGVAPSGSRSNGPPLGRAQAPAPVARVRPASRATRAVTMVSIAGLPCARDVMCGKGRPLFARQFPTGLAQCPRDHPTVGEGRAARRLPSTTEWVADRSGRTRLRSGRTHAPSSPSSHGSRSPGVDRWRRLPQSAW